MHQHGGAHGVTCLVGVRTESVQQDVTLVIQGDGGLAGGIGNGEGVHAHIAGSGSVGGLRRVAAIDLHAGHGAGADGAVEGQRAIRGHGDGEGLARLHLHRGGNGAVPEVVGNIHQKGGIGAHLAGVLDLLGIEPHQRQRVAVVELHRVEGSVGLPGADAAHEVVAIQHFAVQEQHRLGGVVLIGQQPHAVQQVIGVGVGGQRHGRGIGVGVVEVRKVTHITGVDVVGVQHGHLHRDLRRGGGGQAGDGIAQSIQRGRQRLAFLMAQVGQRRLIRQLQRCRPGIPQGRHALGGIAAQLVRVVLFGQILDGLQLHLGSGQVVGNGLIIQLFAGGLQFCGQGLDLVVLVLDVGGGGVALGVKHGGHQGLGLVADKLVRRPGFGGVSAVVAGGGALQRLVQRRGVGLAGGDQVGDGQRNFTVAVRLVKLFDGRSDGICCCKRIIINLLCALDNLQKVLIKPGFVVGLTIPTVIFTIIILCDFGGLFKRLT